MQIDTVVWLLVFNKFHLFIISEIFMILLRNNNNKKSVEKSEIWFLILFSRNSVYYGNCIGQTHFLAIILIVR